MPTSSGEFGMDDRGDMEDAEAASTPPTMHSSSPSPPPTLPAAATSSAKRVRVDDEEVEALEASFDEQGTKARR